MSARRGDRAVNVCLFLLCFFVYAYSYECWVGPNTAASVDQSAAIVMEGRLSIDSFYAQGVGKTVNWSRVEKRQADGSVRGVYYPAKAPGLSLLGVPVYAALLHVERARGEDPLSEPVFLRDVRILALVLGAVVGALGAVVFRRLALAAGAGREAALVAALIIALATTYCPYSSVVYAHVPTAVAIALAGLLVTSGEPTRARAAAAGLLCGIAVMVSYQAALIVPALGLALLARAAHGKARALFAFCAGGLPCLVALAAIHTVCFGAPWRTPYDFQNPAFTDGVSTGYLAGLQGVKSTRIYEVLLSPYRGLFFYAPVLLPVVLATVLDLRDANRRLLAALALWTLGSVLAITCVHPVWWGGSTAGPRLLVPGFALLAPFAARALERWPKTTAGLASISLCHALATTVFGVFAPEVQAGAQTSRMGPDVHDPLMTIVYPAIARGTLLRLNAGTDLGLPVEVSLALFAFGLAILVGLLLWARGREKAGTPEEDAA